MVLIEGSKSGGGTFLDGGARALSVIHCTQTLLLFPALNANELSIHSATPTWPSGTKIDT
jgi:hypothetical protein